MQILFFILHKRIIIFIHFVAPEQYKQLCFSESLLMVDEAGNVSGKMYIRVTQADWGDRHCLCVHSGSYGTPDEGMECGY